MSYSEVLKERELGVWRKTFCLGEEVIELEIQSLSQLHVVMFNAP
jgi:hypothetical protein